MHQDTSLSLILSLPKQTEQVTKTYKLKRLCWLTCLEVQKSPCRGLAWGCVETAPRCIRFKQATLSLPCHKCFGSKCVMQKGNSWCGLSTFALACLKRVFTPGKVPTLMVSKQRNLLGLFKSPHVSMISRVRLPSSPAKRLSIRGMVNHSISFKASVTSKAQGMWTNQGWNSCYIYIYILYYIVMWVMCIYFI